MAPVVRLAVSVSGWVLKLINHDMDIATYSAFPLGAKTSQTSKKESVDKAALTISVCSPAHIAAGPFEAGSLGRYSISVFSPAHIAVEPFEAGILGYYNSTYPYLR